MGVMDFDVESQLEAVKRSVSFPERDGQPATSVKVSRSFATMVENLWGAVTSAERIPRWFLPISGKLQLGGRYQLEGNAGGLITACERPSRFAITWEFAGDVSWVDVDCTEDAAGRARLTLTHTALLSDHWREYGAGAVGVGWELGLMGLDIHITHPDQPMPDETAFAVSTDGKAIIAGSSNLWAQAAIDGGASPGAALAAAERTTAFYTGQPVEPA